MSTSSATWTEEHRALWQRIAAHPFPGAGAPQDFAAQLARSQGWTRTAALAAIDEYRRFCFLAVTSSEPICPSHEVDAVWHLHLTHSRDYWTQWCPQVLQSELHHDASSGGAGELRRHRAQYAQTLALYEDRFGTAPGAWWPSTSERFSGFAHRREVDLRRVWLLPRPRWPRAWLRCAAALLALLGFASAAPAIDGNPLDWNGRDFLQLYLGLIALATVAAWIARRALRDNGQQSQGAGLTTLEIAHLVGGPGRCVDAGVAELMHDQVITLDEGEQCFKVRAGNRNAAESLQALRGLIASDGRVSRVLKLGPRLFGDVAEKLRRLGLLLEPRQALRAALLPAALPGLVLLLGLAKIYVGLERGRPVAFLMLLCIGVAIITALFALRVPTRSRQGDRVVGTLGKQHGRVARSPRESELPLAVALIGTAAMSGTAFAGYHTMRAPPSSSSSSSTSSDSSSSSSDSSGGDSGGGGCGGCGGGGGD